MPLIIIFFRPLIKVWIHNIKQLISSFINFGIIKKASKEA